MNETSPFEDPDLRTAHRLLRNAGFAPAWIEEQKDIDATAQKARATLRRARELYGQAILAASPQWQRAVKEFCETVAELNRRIAFYNLKSPGMVFHRKVIDAEAFVNELESGEEKER